MNVHYVQRCLPVQVQFVLELSEARAFPFLRRSFKAPDLMARLLIDVTLEFIELQPALSELCTSIFGQGL